MLIFKPPAAAQDDFLGGLPVHQGGHVAPHSSGAGRRGQWHLIADVLSQITTQGGRKRWCTGISEKSPKTQLPNRRVGGAIPPAEAIERLQASTFFLTVPLRLLQRLRQLRLPLTDELLHVGSGAARRALVISDFPIFPAPVPRDVALDQRRASSARCERVAGVRRAVQISHTSSKTFCKCSAFSSLHARRRASASVPSSCLSRSSMRRRWCERSASTARPLGGRPLGHLSSRSSAATFLVSASMATSMKGYGLPPKRFHLPSGDAGARTLQRLRYRNRFFGAGPARLPPCPARPGSPPQSTLVR